MKKTRKTDVCWGILFQLFHISGNGAPVILLLFNAGPLNVTWADQSPDVAAIMECFFPAQATGEAIRRVILNDGEAAVPAGRLPMTWPLLASQVSEGHRLSFDCYS